MSSPRFPEITDADTGRKRIRSFDVRVACQQYSNIASVLAGFAFAVIIVIAQENSPSLSEAEAFSRNAAAVGFFVSFFGCVISSFIFALISGEEAFTPRANQMAFFGGLAFSLNISLLFWGIAIVLDAFLVEEVAEIAYQIFPLFLLIHPVFVIASVLDNIYIFDRRNPKPWEYIITIIPSIVSIGFIYLLRLSDVKISIAENSLFFYSTIKVFLALIVIDNIVAGLISTRNEFSRINVFLSSFCIWIHFILLGFLIILV